MRLRVCLLLAFVSLGSATVQQAQAEMLLALTQGNQLVSFDSGNTAATTTVGINGLLAGDLLTGIDARPANNTLFGLAVNGTTGRLYNIDRVTGLASLAATLDTAVNGNFFGVDFNPAVDRLRIVSDTGQNLRVNVDTGATLVDGTLQFAAGDANAGTPPQVIAAAYSNNIAGTGSTTLYTLDLSTQSLLTQAPPNNGTLNTIASLSSILFPEAAFDISGVTGVAYAILNGFELSAINLTTGVATSLGAINAPGNIIGLSAPVGVTVVPEPSSLALMTLGAAWIVRAKWRRRSSAVQADSDTSSS